MLTPLIAFSHFSTCAAPYFPRRCSRKGKEGDWGALLCWGWVWEPTVGRYFKSLHVTLLILFFFWLLTSWFGREKKVTKYIAKKQHSPKQCRLSPYFRTSLSFCLLERKFRPSSSQEPSLALCWGQTGWSLSDEQGATRADLWRGLRAMAQQGTPHCTSPAPETYQQRDCAKNSKEYLFASNWPMYGHSQELLTRMYQDFSPSFNRQLAYLHSFSFPPLLFSSFKSPAISNVAKQNRGARAEH